MSELTDLLPAIQDLVKDKKVLLVGNGVHKEEDLDSYNIVIRMNNGILKGYADIWVNHLLHYHARNWDWDDVHFKYMLRLNAEDKGKKLRRNYPQVYLYKTYFWKPPAFLEYSKRVGYTQPFTGTTTLHWLCANTEPESITVIGMDFFHTHAHAPIHKPIMDREYIQGLAKKFPIQLK